MNTKLNFFDTGPVHFYFAQVQCLQCTQCKRTVCLHLKITIFSYETPSCLLKLCQYFRGNVLNICYAAWRHVQEEGSVHSHRHRYLTSACTFTFIARFALFLLFPKRLDSSCTDRSGGLGGTAPCCLCSPVTLLESFLTSKSRGRINLNPLTGSKHSTGRWGCSLGALTRLQD